MWVYSLQFVWNPTLPKAKIHFWAYLMKYLIWQKKSSIKFIDIYKIYMLWLIHHLHKNLFILRKLWVLRYLLACLCTIDHTVHPLLLLWHLADCHSVYNTMHMPRQQTWVFGRGFQSVLGSKSFNITQKQNSEVFNGKVHDLPPRKQVQCQYQRPKPCWSTFSIP
jgi:hypothetical protein